MRKFNPIYAIAAMMAMTFGFAACNDDDDNEDEFVDNSGLYSVVVNAFHLNANDSILENLDSVYFSIDLNRALIYNADSLPLGTRVDSLLVSISMSGVSKAEITMPTKTGIDTVVDYLTNSSEPINFTRGFVKLHLESSNEQNHRDYNIYVNVHKMKPDSLAWGDAAYTAYPTAIANPTAIRAVEYQSGNTRKALCFSTDGSRYNVASSLNPALRNWENATITAPANLDVNSIVSGESILYALDADHNLYSSADCGVNWTSTGTKMTHIYGVYGTKALGVNSERAGEYVYVTYPATTEQPVPEDAPVEGTSLPLTFTTEWSTDAMLMVMGGLTASGNPTGSMWAFDGNQWACTTVAPIPAASGVTLLPYFSFKVAGNWVATKYTTLFAFGGEDTDGNISRKVYMSVDRGVHWAVAGELMQLPASMPVITGAQALVFESTIESRALASNWKPLEMPRIPSWFTTAEQPKGIAPITSWECPYIYLFGGHLAGGSLNTSVWRGVINRLSFKPLQ